MRDDGDDDDDRDVDDDMVLKVVGRFNKVAVIPHTSQNSREDKQLVWKCTPKPWLPWTCNKGRAHILLKESEHDIIALRPESLKKAARQGCWGKVKNTTLHNTIHTHVEKNNLNGKPKHQ